ncbi:MAG: hypothetical protein [Caudoviricetes sp.]|nr:MAG: hypothetical protein [Caudoviricetes sp.]
MNSFSLGWSEQAAVPTSIVSVTGIFVGMIRDITATTKLLTSQYAETIVSINDYNDGRWANIYNEIGGRLKQGPRDFVVDKKMTRAQIKAALLSAE